MRRMEFGVPATPGAHTAPPQPLSLPWALPKALLQPRGGICCHRSSSRGQTYWGIFTKFA